MNGHYLTRVLFLAGMHFSPRGEAKRVRGPSEQGASRLARRGSVRITSFGPRVPKQATRPLGFSRITKHATWFYPSLRRLQGEQPQARPTGFSRNTRHETRITVLCPLCSPWVCKGRTIKTPRPGPPRTPPDRCFPARCGAAWGGYGAAWAGGPTPAPAKQDLLGFLESGNMFSLCPPATSRRATRSPANRFFTKHETRITAFFSCGEKGRLKSTRRVSTCPSRLRRVATFPVER